MEEMSEVHLNRFCREVINTMDLDHDESAIVMTDVNGKIIHVTPAWESMCLFSFGQVYGRTNKILQGIYETYSL